MGIVDRYRKQRRSEQNQGQPLGGGLDEAPAPPLRGRAFVADLRVDKPVEEGGRRGLRVAFRLELEALAGLRLVLETTLHDQELGQFRSRLPALADTQGLLNVWEIVKPGGDAPSALERAVFFPFEALDAQREGKRGCFARVRVLEEGHGAIAQSEAAFAIEAG